LLAFKQAVLEEARLAALDWLADDVLQEQEKMELERVEKLLNILIPNAGDEQNRKET
jgi:hypothetical protein